MAKKRKKEKERGEEYEFKPPEFDEKEFLRQELRNTRIALYTIGYAGLVGVAAGLVSMVSRDLLGVAFLLVILGIVSLKWVYLLLKVDVKSFTRRNWAGNIGTYFFTFLAVWVLLLNMPFADNSKPSIDKVIVWVERPQGTGTNLTGVEYEWISTQGVYGWVGLWGEDPGTLIRADVNHTINITARVVDNGALRSVQVSIETASSFTDMNPIGDSRYGYSFTGDQLSSSPSLMFYIRAIDKAGNERTFYPKASLVVVG
ncbi:MAG: hypothetical protein ACUVT7_04165 [Thermoplasmata archaeon]